MNLSTEDAGQALALGISQPQGIMEIVPTPEPMAPLPAPSGDETPSQETETARGYFTDEEA